MSSADVRSLLRRSWWVILLVAVIGGSAAWAVTKRQHPIYRATASILVVQTTQAGPISYQDIQASQSLTRTYASLATSRESLQLALPALADLGLTVDLIQKQVTASAIQNTQLVDIVAEDENPVQAARIANAAADAVPLYVNRIQLGGTSGEVTLSPIIVARRATAPKAPVRPSVPLNTAFGVVAGLTLGVFAAFVRQRYDDRIRETDDLAELDVPVLGVILHAPRPRGVGREWTPTIQDTGSEFEDSCRQMNVLLAYSLAATQAKVVVVTSALANEGKTTTAMNLAIVMSESGKNVLLIDGDLRKPSLHQRWNLPNTAGLTASFLTDPSAVNRFVTEISPTLRVLVAGPRPPSPAQLIGSVRISEMLESLRDAADFILVDIPPILGLADAVLWLRNADAVLMVARSGRTRLGELAEAIQTVEAVGTPILGVVLNDSKPAHRRAAYHYD